MHKVWRHCHLLLTDIRRAVHTGGVSTKTQLFILSHLVISEEVFLTIDCSGVCICMIKGH